MASVGVSGDGVGATSDVHAYGEVVQGAGREPEYAAQVAQAGLRRGMMGKPVTVQLPGETVEQENRRLKRALAEKVLEVDFLQGALQQVEARRRQNTASGARASTPRSGE